MFLPKLETGGITRGRSRQARYPSSLASSPPCETPRCPTGGEQHSEHRPTLRKEEQPQLVTVPPWGCRADGGVPSNTPLSGRTLRYRGRQLLLGGSSVSRRAVEPTASPLSLESAWCSTDSSARRHGAGQWRRAPRTTAPSTLCGVSAPGRACAPRELPFPAGRPNAWPPPLSLTAVTRSP